MSMNGGKSIPSLTLSAPTTMFYVLFLLALIQLMPTPTYSRLVQDPLDASFQHCCGTRDYVTGFYGECTYAAHPLQGGTLKTLRRLSVSPLALREWVECASQRRNNTECCVAEGMDDPSCLPFCDGSDTGRIQLNLPPEYICSGTEENDVEAIRKCHYVNAS